LLRSWDFQIGDPGSVEKYHVHPKPKMRSGRNRLPDPAHTNNAQSFPGDMLTQMK
jgi:hypothetical protein